MRLFSSLQTRLLAAVRSIIPVYQPEVPVLTERRNF